MYHASSVSVLAPLCRCLRVGGILPSQASGASTLTQPWNMELKTLYSTQRLKMFTGMTL